MITTNLTGNLGNHMWQLASSKSIALDLGYDWGVNPTPSHDYHNGMDQMYFMDVDFGLPVTGISNTFCELWLTHQHVDLVNVTVKDNKVYEIPDNTIILGHNNAAGAILQSVGYFTHREAEVRDWFQIKEEYRTKYEDLAKSEGIVFDDNLCVINFRGGEYNSIPNVMLRPKYWTDCIKEMSKNNKEMRFFIVTDDPQSARNYIGRGIDIIHKDIGFDFFVVNSAKNLIIANSTFSWWAAWLSEADTILAPKYWARHNVSDGYWATGDACTPGFIYMDREGDTSSFTECILEYDKNI
jgi:hypothetical protein